MLINTVSFSQEQSTSGKKLLRCLNWLLRFSALVIKLCVIFFLVHRLVLLRRLRA